MPARGRLGFLATALLVHTTAHAEPGAGAAKPSIPVKVEHPVDFRADRVELTPDAGSLDLSGRVVVSSRRFRLTSEKVTLSRTHRGVHVVGKGELALCSCPEPPVTFGFRAADLAPPTDVLLEGATVRVGPVPVFWSPYLWLRSPTRLGLLPPFIAYRGEEGILLGTGVHVPLTDEEGTRGALDVAVGAYLLGGARVDAVVKSASGRTAVAFDIIDGAALDVSSAHAVTARGDAVLSERIDWLSGERALVAPASLERVALGSNRLRAGVSHARVGSFGMSFVADASRDASLSDLGNYGPALGFDWGGALGARARYSLGVGARSLNTPTGAAFVASNQLGLSTAAELGVLRYEVLLREGLEVVTEAEGHAEDLRSELRQRLGVPLTRRYTAVVHALEPFVEAALSSGVRSDDGPTTAFSDLLPPSRGLLALAGVDTALGAPLGRRAGELSVAAGTLSDAGSEVLGVVAGRARIDAGSVRGAFDARWLPSESASELSVRAQARTAEGVQVGLSLASAVRDARAAASFWSDDFLRPKGALLAASGVTAGARLGIPWASRILTEVGADVDISEKRWLSSSAALGYRHSCRCLSMLASASRRLGRKGFDLGVSVELVPH